VLAACDREGSADTEILNPVPNDFSRFWQEHQRIDRICCNGQTALRLFLKLVGLPEAPLLPARPMIIGLPSTSPAFTLDFAQKRVAWGEGLETISR